MLTESPGNVLIAAESNIGCVRAANEDSFCLVAAPDKAFTLAAVADGVGGHANGEVASYMCCRRLLLNWKTLGKSVAVPTEAAMAKFLDQSITAANREVYSLNVLQRRKLPMCSTVAAAVFSPRMVIVAHVGDSRLYCLRDGKLLKLTTDHTLRNELLERNPAASDAALPASSIISRAVGPWESIRPEIHVFHRCAGDRFLLCSDGLIAHVADAEITEILGHGETPRQAVSALIRQTLRGGGSDNVTVICAFSV